jgi:hypothetical protein
MSRIYRNKKAGRCRERERESEQLAYFLRFAVRRPKNDGELACVQIYLLPFLSLFLPIFLSFHSNYRYLLGFVFFLLLMSVPV